MKPFQKTVICISVFLLLGSCHTETDGGKDADIAQEEITAVQTEPVKSPMSVYSTGIQEGILSDEYGKRGTEMSGGIPVRSLPLRIENAPEDTVCFALIMKDPDAKPLCGYEWVHWLAANITQREIVADASLQWNQIIIQGKNDFGIVGYGGPTPPDKPHTYILSVYALDSLLDIEDGFSEQQLLDVMQCHVLEQIYITAQYSN